MLPSPLRVGLEHGLLALSDVCPKDRIQLRFCESSAWFECPACGSMFNGLGDWTAGPAPAGMFLQRVTIDEDEVVSVDRRPLHPGVAHGSALVQHRAAGPHCI